MTGDISAIMLKFLAILYVLTLSALVDTQKPLPMKGNDQKNQSYEKKDAPNPLAPATCGSSVCKENADNAEREAYYEAHPKEYLKAAIAPANLSNWILAILAGVGGIVAWRTLVVMRRGSERQLRAYVLPERAEISNVADPPLAIGPPRETAANILYPEWGAVAMVYVKNMGQTPAHDVLHGGALIFREFPLKTSLPTIPTSKGLIGTPLGPGVYINKKTDHPPLTFDQLTSLRKGESSFYLYGEIKYRDIFMKRHFTRYCLLHNPDAGPIGVSTFFTVAEEGNETDDTKNK